MRFDPTILARQPLQVLALVAVVVLGKSAVAFLIVLLLHYRSVRRSSLPPVWRKLGEFSFILAELGIALRLLPAEGQSRSSPALCCLSL
jgi:K+:H+ antiporter